jgi:enoyl-CoA hydratase/carnithine racemase
MAVATRFAEYRDRYETIAMERTDGVLEVTFHTGAGSLEWGRAAHDEFGHAFADIARDDENRVVIMTGTGDQWCGNTATPDRFGRKTASQWDHTFREGLRLTWNLLDLNAIVISCVNGPATRHPEIPLLADIVLACPEALFQDSAHFSNRMTPGDGVHFILPLLLGFNRARYFLLTGQTLTAQQLHEFGVISEIVPRAALLERAHGLADELRRQNPLVLSYTRRLLMHDLKRTAHDLLGYGLALEGLGVVEETERLTAAGSGAAAAPPAR